MLREPLIEAVHDLGEAFTFLRHVARRGGEDADDAARIRGMSLGLCDGVHWKGGRLNNLAAEASGNWVELPGRKAASSSWFAPGPGSSRPLVVPALAGGGLRTGSSRDYQRGTVVWLRRPTFSASSVGAPCLWPRLVQHYKPRMGEVYLRECPHLAPPGLGWIWAGLGYKHGAPTELNERLEPQNF